MNDNLFWKSLLLSTLKNLKKYNNLEPSSDLSNISFRDLFSIFFEIPMVFFDALVKDIDPSKALKDCKSRFD